MPLHKRHSWTYRIQKALREPYRTLPYLKKAWADFAAQRRSASHEQFYRQVMSRMVTKEGVNRAIGSASEGEWDAIGRMQFDFLLMSGLASNANVLEIGCGNLRAGRYLIRYLDDGCYTGLDISPEILASALDVIVRENLEEKRPRLFYIERARLDFLPSESIDVIHAHSVFSHTPIEIIETYLRQARRLIRATGFFDLTYLRSDRPGTFLSEEFYYPVQVLASVAREAGWNAVEPEGWSYTQEKLRLYPQTQWSRPSD